MTAGSGSDAPTKDDKGQGRDSGRTLWLAIWLMTAVTTATAASGQIAVWAWAGLSPEDPRRFGLPFQTELAVVLWLMIGKWAVTKERSPYPWWFLAFLFASLAVYMNVVHGGWKQGLIFGTASGATLAFWFAKFYLDYIGHDVGKRLRVGARPKVLGPASLFQPRIDFKAFMIVKRRIEVVTVEDARTLAELWIWVYQDTRAYLGQDRRDEGDKIVSKRVRWGKRSTARRTAWLTVNTECGVKVIEPKGIRVAGVTFAKPAPIEQDVRVPESWTRAEQNRTAPKLPTVRKTAANAQVSAPPANPVGADPDDAPAELFKLHADRINKVQDVFRDWATRETPYKVDEVGQLIGNRQHAAQVAKCLRTLRRNMTTNQGGDTT